MSSARRAQTRSLIERAMPMTFALFLLAQFVVLYAPRVPSAGGGVPGLDKAVHLVVFAAVALTGLLSALPERWLIPLLLAHAAVSEAIQHLMLPDRSGDAVDVLANAAGVLLGWALARGASRLSSGVPPAHAPGR